VVCEFSRLKKLTLSGAQNVTGPGLRCLAEVPSLESLSVESLRPLKPIDLQFLTSLGKLRELEINCADLPDEALKQLASLRALKSSP
jgi:hypothetical protein